MNAITDSSQHAESELSVHSLLRSHGYEPIHPHTQKQGVHIYHRSDGHSVAIRRDTDEWGHHKIGSKEAPTEGTGHGSLRAHLNKIHGKEESQHSELHSQSQHTEIKSKPLSGDVNLQKVGAPVLGGALQFREQQTSQFAEEDYHVGLHDVLRSFGYKRHFYSRRSKMSIYHDPEAKHAVFASKDGSWTHGSIGKGPTEGTGESDLHKHLTSIHGRPSHTVIRFPRSREES